MQGVRRPRIKICCIQNKEEAFTAIDFGASAIGLVSEMPSGPGPISDEKISEIAAVVPPPIATFLLTRKCCPNFAIPLIIWNCNNHHNHIKKEDRKIFSD